MAGIGDTWSTARTTQLYLYTENGQGDLRVELSLMPFFLPKKGSFSLFWGCLGRIWQLDRRGLPVRISHLVMLSLPPKSNILNCVSFCLFITIENVVSCSSPLTCSLSLMWSEASFQFSFCSSDEMGRRCRVLFSKMEHGGLEKTRDLTCGSILGCLWWHSQGRFVSSSYESRTGNFIY